MKIQMHALCLMSLAAGMWAQSPTSPLANIPLKNWDAPLHWLPPSAQEALRQKVGEPSALDAAGATQPLQLVAITPCRVVDTRAGSGFPGAFGPPSLQGGTPRTIPIPSSSCGIPSSAAYSLNFTLVCTYGPVGFVAAWPDNVGFPGTSITNAFTGGVVANAAVVPAGPDGGIDVMVSSAGDVIVDINGYYAAPGAVQGNTALGTGALANNTTGSNNTASGDNALQSNTTGSFNTADGGNALRNNTTGIYNTASGYNALQSNTTGIYNTASGYNALQSNTTGTNNTAIGQGALAVNTTGNLNTAIGIATLASLSSGIQNVAIGNSAGFFLGTGDNNIIIANLGVNGDSGTIRIGDSRHNRTFLAGTRGTITGSSDAIPVVIDSNGQLGTVSSSARLKEDIQDMAEASDGLLELRPVTFRYKQPYSDGSKPLDYGLIAEEVAEVYPDLVVKGASGQVETVQYQKLTPMLLNELQKQNRQILEQGETIRIQQEQNRKLEARLAALEALMSSKASATGQ